MEIFAQQQPDMVIGSNIKVKGDMKFDGLLRIDGNVDGQLISPVEVKIFNNFFFRMWISYTIYTFFL
jgi:cytoskeletal protein CcmA (bactofilin family)